MEMHGGQVRRRTDRRGAVAAIIAVLLLAAGLAWRAGAVTPRFAPGGGSEYGADSGTFFYRFSVRNDGLIPMTIVDAGRGGPGLELTSVDGALPVTLSRGAETEIKLSYRVTDCTAVSEEAWPVPLTVDRPWGGQTVHLPLPTQLQSEWRGGDLPPLGVVRRGPVEWQRSLADLACALRNR